MCRNFINTFDYMCRNTLAFGFTSPTYCNFFVALDIYI